MDPCDDHISEIEPGLFQSDAVGCVPPGIDAIVNLCTKDEWNVYQLPGGRFTRMMFAPIEDGPFRGFPWLDSTVDTIIRWREEGLKCLVHCAAGISRSTLVVAAVLMKTNYWSAGQALDHIGAIRPIINPNRSFKAALLEYESWLKDKR